MKKVFFIFVLSLWSIAGWAQGYDFYADAPSGQRLYYKISHSTDGDNASIVGPTGDINDPWRNVAKPTGDLIIPNTVEHNSTRYPVMAIALHAFRGCSGLTSVIIPNSVVDIATGAFSNCSGLTSVVIGSSVMASALNSRVFAGCSSLKTVFWLVDNNPPSATTFKTNHMDRNDAAPCRIIRSQNISPYGSGDNTIYYVRSGTLLVDSEDGNSSHIPYSSLPTNFIGVKNALLVAREIVLTDGEDAFNVPNFSPFTAGKATYRRSFTNGNRSTLCLPFSAAVPEGLEVYEFSNYDNSTHTLNFAPVADNSIQAYTPYLVGYGLSKAEQTTCTITATDVSFTATTPTPTSSNGISFQGTMERTCMNSNNYGYSNGFFVQSGNGGDHDGHAHVNPFRCYFTYSGTPAQMMPPAALGIGFDSNPLGIETPETAHNGSIRYSNDVYDLMGRLVRRNAQDLKGLPRGVYVWRGEKVVKWE